MLTCPMCKKRLRGLEKECANCRTDVSLLVDYVDNLREGLIRAEAFTKAGELGEAVWEYLNVLEIDPDNATARRQVGRVATAVRQFDNTAPGRRWFHRLRKQTRFRRWAARVQEGEGAGILSSLLWFLLVFVALLLGYYLGAHSSTTSPTPDTPPSNEKPEKIENKAG
ncbi:MAG TPA: hypothetical protein VFA18_01970 [Gemmataceae bacterium]|nr:hypothetical protein [Gemmataceae bacterium]